MEMKTTPTWKFILVASVAAGVQFGWALQLSLLTPYVQLLGVSHTWSSFIWLCGPISGILVQPIVGFSSDRIKWKFGRRKPFIATGVLLISLALLLIGFAADIGYKLGDNLDKETKPRAVALFVAGFWILDVANNMVQDPSRAFLGDLSMNDHTKMTMANGLFSFFMAVGNVLGYAAGSTPKLYKLFSFTKTEACDIYCANLKTCFLLDILFLLITAMLPIIFVAEPQVELDVNVKDPFFTQVKNLIKSFGKPIWCLLMVTAVNWIGWYSFIMYDTDWVGREIYGGLTQGTPSEKQVYDMGVRVGSLGLLLMAAVLGVVSLLITPLSKLIGGNRRVWGIANFVLAISLASTLPITKFAEKERKHRGLGHPSPHIKSATLAMFAATGIAQAATYSIPFAMALMFSSDSGAGHGLTLGVMNLSICIPQMFVAVINGPWNNVFGGGNLPAFMLGSFAAMVSGILAILVVPAPSSNV